MDCTIRYVQGGGQLFTVICYPGRVTDAMIEAQQRKLNLDAITDPEMFKAFCSAVGKPAVRVVCFSTLVPEKRHGSSNMQMDGFPYLEPDGTKKILLDWERPPDNSWRGPIEFAFMAARAAH